MLAFGAVRSGLAAEVVALHHAGGALALAGADHVNELHTARRFRHRRWLPACDGGRFFQADFAEVLARRDARLGTVADQRERAVLGLDFVEPDLDGVVAIALDGLHLRDGARPGLYDGHGHNAPFSS